MKFKKIKFENYRCFLDGEITFEEHDGKNINLIIGTNGADLINKRNNCRNPANHVIHCYLTLSSYLCTI